MGIIAAVTAIAGVGLSAFSAVGQANAASRSAELQQEQIAEQQKQEALRKRAMELDARRRQMEVLRNQQRARSIALATSTGQGAGLGGSQLQGAYGQISGQANTQGVGIEQNLDLGRQMFDINANISSNRIAMAGVAGESATYGALGSLGGTLINSMGAVGRLGQGVFLNSPAINMGYPGGGYYGGVDAAGRYPGPGQY